MWVLEDCWYVFGSFEWFLIVCGERVVRVLTRLMVTLWCLSCERGKSDRIDAIVVACAVFVEGIEMLLMAELVGFEFDIWLLVDHCERLVC